jgi:hypothetical protein
MVATTNGITSNIPVSTGESTCLVPIEGLSWQERMEHFGVVALHAFCATVEKAFHENKWGIMVTVPAYHSQEMHCKLHQFGLCHEGIAEQWGDSRRGDYDMDNLYDVFMVWPERTGHDDPDCKQVCTIAERIALQKAGLV